MVDLVPPDAAYSAARYATDAAAVIGDITARGRLPILVGGTGLYYRALTRGIFPGPTRHDRLRAYLHGLAAREGPERLHRWVARLDPASGQRIQPRDEKRLVRALEVALRHRRAADPAFRRHPVADRRLPRHDARAADSRPRSPPSAWPDASISSSIAASSVR